MINSTERDQKQRGAHIPELDGVRGVAILGVLLCHFSGIFADSQSWTVNINRVFGLGGHGVDLFFVLSGYLITGILLDATPSIRSFGVFYWRRFLRIFPLYYSYLCVVFLVAHPLCKSIVPWDYTEPRPWAYFLYIQNWMPGLGVGGLFLSHTWSLAIEEQFYLVWPLLVFVLPRRVLVPFCFAVLASSVAMRGRLMWQDVWIQSAYRLTRCRLDTLMIGALIAMAVRSSIWKVRLQRASRPVFVASLLVVAVTIVVANSFAWVTFGWLMLAILFGSAVVLSLQPESWFACAMRNSVFRSFGIYSYGIYMLHAFFNELGPLLLIPGEDKPGMRAIAQAMFIPTMIAASWCCAWVSYNYFEVWFIKQKRLFD